MVTDVSRCRAMTVPFRTPRPSADEPVSQLADPFDITDELVVWREPALRIARHANTTRRSSEDDVARQQRRDGRQLRDERRHGEDQVRGPSLLHLFAVDRAAELQI